MTEHGMVIDETFGGTSSPIDIAFQPIVAKKYLELHRHKNSNGR